MSLWSGLVLHYIILDAATSIKNWPEPALWTYLNDPKGYKASESFVHHNHLEEADEASIVFIWV